MRIASARRNQRQFGGAFAQARKCAISMVMTTKSPEDRRKERLAQQLRANLARRKAQARAKRAGEADERPEGLGAAGKGASDPVENDDS
jgi:hypothetical protein